MAEPTVFRVDPADPLPERDNVPDEFTELGVLAWAARSRASDVGHRAGREEIITGLRDLVAEFQAADEIAGLSRSAAQPWPICSPNAQSA